MTPGKCAIADVAYVILHHSAALGFKSILEASSKVYSVYLFANSKGRFYICKRAHFAFANSKPRFYIQDSYSASLNSTLNVCSAAYYHGVF